MFLIHSESKLEFIFVRLLKRHITDSADGQRLIDEHTSKHQETIIGSSETGGTPRINNEHTSVIEGWLIQEIDERFMKNNHISEIGGVIQPQETYDGFGGWAEVDR